MNTGWSLPHKRGLYLRKTGRFFVRRGGRDNSMEKKTELSTLSAQRSKWSLDQRKIIQVGYLRPDILKKTQTARVGEPTFNRGGKSGRLTETHRAAVK